MSNILLNNYKTTLVSPIGAADTQIYVGHSLPALGVGDYYLLTLFARSGAEEYNWEIVKVTAAGGSVLTVERGQEGTAARVWANGSLVEMRLTAGQVSNKADSVHSHEVSDVNGLQSSLSVLESAIASLGTAQGRIAQDSSPALVLNTSNQTLPFTVTTDSTNTDMFALNGIDNTITFNRNANYTFMSTVTFHSSTSNQIGVTFRLVDTATDMVIAEQEAEVEIPSGDAETIPFNTLLTVGKNGVPSAPLVIRVEVVATGTGLTINQFDSVLTSGSAYDIAPFVLNDSTVSTSTAWSSDKVSNELVGKADESHAHAISDVTGLQTALSDKASLTGTETLTNKTVESVTLTNGYTEEVFAITGTTPSLSPLNGSIQTWALTGNSTPTLGTWNAGQSLTLMIDDGSAYSVTWTNLSVTWKTNSGVAPTLNTSGYTVIALWKVGSVIYGARVGDA